MAIDIPNRCCGRQLFVVRGTRSARLRSVSVGVASFLSSELGVPETMRLLNRKEELAQKKSSTSPVRRLSIHPWPRDHYWVIRWRNDSIAGGDSERLAAHQARRSSLKSTGNGPRFCNRDKYLGFAFWAGRIQTVHLLTCPRGYSLLYREMLKTGH